MIKKIKLSLLACCFSSISFGQSMADINSPKIVPPSPDAAALGKYAQIPVDKSTGIPGISIPLYEIKTPRLSLPISLSYHASGVKVDETASWVGLGWSLNAAGVITRSMVGIADDKPNIGFLSPTPPVLRAAEIRFPRDSQYMEDVSAYRRDTQPDNFFYNFAGNSGGFIFGIDKAPVTIPYKPVKITSTPGTGTTLQSFTIVDESGNSYIFSDTEITTSSISAQLTGISSWYLSKVISADKSDTLKFTYTADATQFSDISYSFSQNIGPYGTNGGLWPLVRTNNSTQCQQIHLSSIQFKGGKVDFVAKTGRIDNGNVSLDAVIVYAYDFNLRQYTKIKSFKLLTDYFVSTISNPSGYPTDDKNTHRLKLTGLTENDSNDAVIKVHQFDYNSTMLPPVHNFGQDKWGYYNGHYDNQSLLEAQQVTSDYTYFSGGAIFSSSPVTYTIGAGQGGDRSLSPTNMQAAVLQKITYPTKGYTMLDYEPNQYLNWGPVTNHSVNATSTGYYHDTTTVSYTPLQSTIDAGHGTTYFHIHIKSTNNVYSNLDSYVKLTRVSDGALLYRIYATTSTDLDTDIPQSLSATEQYQLTAVSKGGTSTTPTSSLPTATISTKYYTTGSPAPDNAGGLRVKSIKNYDSNNVILSTETYKYGPGESGTGEFLTYPSLMTNHSAHFYQIGLDVQTIEDTYSNNSAYPLSSLSGSPVAYSQVAIYRGDATQNAGKSVYGYTITPDSILVCPNTFALQTSAFPVVYTIPQNLKPIPRLWQNGEPVYERHYKNAGSGQYLLVQEKYTNYNILQRAAGRGLYAAYGVEFSGSSRSDFNLYTILNDFIFYDYPISNGSRLPNQTVTINYAADGVTQQVRDTTRYYYDNRSHVYPTRVVSFNGRGDSLVNKVSYPQDMINAGADPTGIYAAMTTANMIRPVIEFSEFKNSTQLKKSKTNYSIFNTTLIEPQSVELQFKSNSSEARLQYLAYDTKGYLQSVSKANGPKQCYIYSYGGLYPIAKIDNADYSAVVTALGGTTAVQNFQAKGSPTDTEVNTFLAPLRTSLNGALVSTYTYKPWIGMATSTDTKGMTTYYEYDTLQRLMNVKNKDGDIVKHYDYHYNGQ